MPRLRKRNARTKGRRALVPGMPAAGAEEVLAKVVRGVGAIPNDELMIKLSKLLKRKPRPVKAYFPGGGSTLRTMPSLVGRKVYVVVAAWSPSRHIGDVKKIMNQILGVYWSRTRADSHAAHHNASAAKGMASVEWWKVL